MKMLKNYLSTNTKLKKDGIFSFGIPAWKSQQGIITCPGASKCIAGCYARQGMYNMPSVKKAQEMRLALTQDRSFFVAVIDTELRKRKVRMLRIHDSGDFYSREYLETWLLIIRLNPDVKFYAYSKNIPIFSGIQLPDNFHLIFSEGGRFDAMIHESNNHARVFKSRKELKAAGYSDASKSDLMATRAKKIGLVYHGAPKKAWNTAKK